MLSTSVGLAVALSGGASDGVPLVSDLGLAANYQSNDAADPTALLIITAKRNGTVTITVGIGDSLTGSPDTVDWAEDPTATVGDGAEVQFVVTNQVNTPSITNNASTPTALTSDRTITISKGGGATASCDVQVIITSGPNSVNDTTNVQVDGT